MDSDAQELDHLARICDLRSSGRTEVGLGTNGILEHCRCCSVIPRRAHLPCGPVQHADDKGKLSRHLLLSAISPSAGVLSSRATPFSKRLLSPLLSSTTPSRLSSPHQELAWKFFISPPAGFLGLLQLLGVSRNTTPDLVIGVV